MDGTFVGELYLTYFEYNLLEYPSMATAYRRPILSSRKIRGNTVPVTLCLVRCDRPKVIFWINLSACCSFEESTRL